MARKGGGKKTTIKTTYTPFIKGRGKGRGSAACKRCRSP
jgi:hypothetical protein